MPKRPRHARTDRGDAERGGFTLIELLVVIAVISLLSSLLYANLAAARTRTIDARKRADLSSVRTALTDFHLTQQRMPSNYDCTTGPCTQNANRPSLAVEDMANPDNPQTESGRAFRASMLELVNAGHLPQVPRSPGGAPYVYYNYGSGGPAGALIGTALDSVVPTESGVPGSCRPFPYDADNWPTPAPGSGGAAVGLAQAQAPSGEDNLCSRTEPSTDYCVCVTY